MSKMKKYLEKFRKIHTALLERRDDPEYQEIFLEIEQFLDIVFDSLNFDEIEDYFKRMQALDEMLPDIDDVENMMMDNTRFDLPES